MYKNMAKRTSERSEIFMRLLVFIITGLILSVWKSLIYILAIINWFIVLFTAKRNKEIAEFSEYWNSEVYIFIRYLTFVTNKRPFPFDKLTKISRFEK